MLWVVGVVEPRRRVLRALPRAAGAGDAEGICRYRVAPPAKNVQERLLAPWLCVVEAGVLDVEHVRAGEGPAWPQLGRLGHYCGQKSIQAAAAAAATERSAKSARPPCL